MVYLNTSVDDLFYNMLPKFECLISAKKKPFRYAKLTFKMSRKKSILFGESPFKCLAVFLGGGSARAELQS